MGRVLGACACALLERYLWGDVESSIGDVEVPYHKDEEGHRAARYEYGTTKVPRRGVVPQWLVPRRGRLGQEGRASARGGPGRRCAGSLVDTRVSLFSCRGLSACLVVVCGRPVAGGWAVVRGVVCGCSGARFVVEPHLLADSRSSSTTPRYTAWCTWALGTPPLSVPLRCWGSSDRNCLPAAAVAQVRWYLAAGQPQPPEARSKPGLGSRVVKVRPFVGVCCGSGTEKAGQFGTQPERPSH